MRKGRIIFGTDYERTLVETGVLPEAMKTENGLSCIRRVNEEGNHYFISALKAEDTEGWIPLGVQAESAMIYNPVNGESGKAAVRQADGRTEVYLQLASGESLLLKTFAGSDIQASAWNYWHPASEGEKYRIDGDSTLWKVYRL